MRFKSIWFVASAAFPALGDTKPEGIATEIHQLSTEAALAKRYEDVIKLRLLANSTSPATRAELAEHFPDLESQLWFSLDGTGFCPENIEKDDELWPVVLHNYLVTHARDRQKPPGKNSFDAKHGQIQRDISIHSSIGLEEWRSLRLSSRDCTAVRNLLDRQYRNARGKALELGRAKAMLALLDQFTAKNPEQEFLINARVLNILLWLGGNDPDAPARVSGLLDGFTSSQPKDWLALSPELQEIVFPLIQAERPAEDKRRKLILGVVDLATDARDGKAVERWLGWLEPFKTDEDWERLAGLDLPRRFLILDPDHGFHERGVFALLLAKKAQANQNLDETLKYLAMAHHFAPESLANEDAIKTLVESTVRSITYQYRLDETMIALLNHYLDRSLFQSLAIDLVWQGAILRDPLLGKPGADRFWQTLPRELNQLRPWLTKIARGATQELTNDYKIAVSEHDTRVLGQFERLLRYLGPMPPEIKAGYMGLLRKISSINADAGNKSIVKSRIAQIDALLIPILPLDSDPTLKTRLSQLADLPISLGTIAKLPDLSLPWPFQPRPEISPDIFKSITIEPELAQGGGPLVWRFKS